MAELAQATKSEVVQKLRNAESRVRRLKQQVESGFAIALTSVTVAGSAFASGFLRGRMSDDKGEWKIKKIPVELLLAAGAHLGGWLTGSQLARSLHTIGDGPLGFWSGMKGFVYGLEYKEKHPKTEGRRKPGQLPPGFVPQKKRAQQQQTAPAWR